MVERAVYSQPLTSKPANITVNYDDLGACPGLTSLLNPENGVYDNATQPVIGTSCADNEANLVPQPVTRYFTWSDGSSSVFQGSFSPVYIAAGLQVTFTGTMVSGTFAGSPAVMTLTFPNLNVLACQLGGAGVSQIYGYGTLEIITL
ncbi:hypothetical protein GCM10027066_11240 [Dyella jejuensis]